jgi:predicted alpha/beta hydrolase family esterase
MSQEMKQQIVIIHGGDVFNTYEDYLSDLMAKELSLDRLSMRGWKSTLPQDLGGNFTVISPKMPNAQNAKYLEWKIWFEKIIPLLDETVIFIGHSLGGLFLVKYLAENTYPKTIKTVFLIAAPYSTPTQRPLGDFILTTQLNTFARQAKKIYLYHSKDDVVVPFKDAEHYQSELPMVNLTSFEDRGHFTGEHFTELVKDIKKLNT